MTYQPKVYTIGHVLGMTGMVAAATSVIYSSRHKQADLVWFMENWGLYIGMTCTALTFCLAFRSSEPVVRRRNQLTT